MFKKSMIVALVLAGILTLTSCGKNNVNNETDSNIVDGVSSVVDDVVSDPLGTEKESVTKPPVTTSSSDTETRTPVTGGTETSAIPRGMK